MTMIDHDVRRRGLFDRRWFKVLVGILLAGLLGYMMFAFGRGPDSEPDSVYTNPPVSMPDAWRFSGRDDTVTRVVAPDGMVVYDNNHSADDWRVFDFDHKLGEDGVARTKLYAPATVALPDGSTAGTTVNVEVSTDSLVKLIEQYNNLPKNVPGYGLYDNMKAEGAGFLLRNLMEVSGLKSQVNVQLIAVGDPVVRTNQLVAEAYAKGYSAWELAVGNSDFSHHDVYEYEFACIRYAVKVGDNAHLPAYLAPDIPFTYGVSETAAVLVNTDLPCDITVNKGKQPPR